MFDIYIFSLVNLCCILKNLKYETMRFEISLMLTYGQIVLNKDPCT